MLKNADMIGAFKGPDGPDYLITHSDWFQDICNGNWYFLSCKSEIKILYMDFNYIHIKLGSLVSKSKKQFSGDMSGAKMSGFSSAIFPNLLISSTIFYVVALDNVQEIKIGIPSSFHRKK